METAIVVVITVILRIYH